MLAIARRNAIKEQLQERKSVTIADLASRLNVTKETIRRDLRVMEEAGELIRTHGGAYILEGVQNDIDVSMRQVLLTAEKENMARKCEKLIQSGDYIFLDGSTTAWCIARRLMDRKVTVLTNSLEIANILSSSKTVHLYVVGGEFYANTMSFGGQGTQRTLGQYFVDKAFISTTSVSMEHGMTDATDNAAAIHRIALEHARQKYLVVDHSKLDNVSFAGVAKVKVLDGMVTDGEPDARWREFLKENGVSIY